MRNDGQTAAEYLVVLSVIIIAIVATVTLLSETARNALHISGPRHRQVAHKC